MSLKRQFIDEAIKMIKEELGEQPPYESKDIYLKSGQDIVGLHSVGDNTESGWQQYEAWCNLYDADWRFIRSIYRISGPIEEEAEALKVDGWIEVKRPTEVSQ